MAGFLYVYTGLLCRGKITIGWVISTTPTVIEINDTHTLNSLKLALSVKNITLDANPVASAAESEKVEEYSNYIGFYCTDLSDDIDTFTIEPLTGETDFTGYNNLLNILGATNVYTETSVTLEQMGDWNGWKRSKNFGARLPISLYLDNSKLVVGFTNNFEPITESTAGEDKITANGIYTPRLIFRRGFKISIRLSYNQIRLLNIFQNAALIFPAFFLF